MMAQRISLPCNLLAIVVLLLYSSGVKAQTFNDPSQFTSRSSSELPVVSAIPPDGKAKQSDGVVLSYEEIPGTPSVEIRHSTLATYSTTPTVSIAGKELVVNGNIQPLTCTFSELDSADLRVVFDLGEEYRLGKTIGTTASISVLIIGYSGLPGSPGSVVMTTTCTLKAGELAPEQVFRANVKNWYTGIGHFAVRVTAYNGTTIATVQNAIRLVLSCVVKWKVGARAQFDPLYPVTGPIYLKTLTPTGNPITQNPVTFRWDGASCTPNFPLYQLQILRLYNTVTTSTLETDMVAEVDWSKALTVETSQTSLTLTLAEGEGYYQWRVRPIGSYYDGGITHPWNWGEWTTTATLDPIDGKLHLSTGGPIPGSIFFYEQFDDEKNWIFNRTFTEHAKMGETMTYANGLQMSEQIQRRMQSQTTKVIQQTLYDYAGRSALNTLAVPYTESGGSTGNALKYVDRVNVMSYNSDRYNIEHFDREASGTVYQPQPVNGGVLYTYYTATGSGNIPNAEGYPYNRTLYYSDGANRTKEGSSAGATHRMGAGHTSRTYYAAVTEQELVRIFGDEAPDPTSVAKIVQYDPNTTGTVQYTSKEGQVIATALVAGTNGEPLELLDEEEIFSSSGGEITDYIIQPPAKAQNVKSGKSLRAGKTIVLTEPGNVYLDYELTPRAFKEACMNVCVSCDYRVYFTIYSTDDNSIKFSDSVIIAPGAFVTNPSSCENGAPEIRNGMTAYLQPGSYRVERRIESDNPVAAEKVSYLTWHKQQIAQEVRDRFDALNGGNGLEYIMTKYLSDTATAKLQDMYNYLYTHFGSLTLSIGCASINIPEKRCPQTKCEQGNHDFEQYLKSRLGEPEKLGSHFGSHKAYKEIQNWEWGSFNTVIQNMIADGYDCEQLWQCWELAVELKASQGDPEVSSAYGDDAGNQSVHLLDAFLDCTGRQFTTPSCDIENYLKKPYKYFCNEPANGGDVARYNQCSTAISASYGAIDESNEWEMVYRCWIGTETPPDQPVDKAVAAGELRDSCRSVCEYRRESFRRAIIRAYLEMNPAIDTTTIPVSCILDSLVENCKRSCDDIMDTPPIPEWVYKKIVNFMSSGFDLAVPSAVVPACNNGYSLIGTRQVTPAMLQAQIDVINGILMSYQKLIWEQGPTPTLISELTSKLLEELYDLVKESPSCALPYAPTEYVYKERIIKQILTLWQQGQLWTSRVQLYLNGCQLEMRTGTHVQAGCIYEQFQDEMVYTFPIEDVITSTSNCIVVKVPPTSEAIVLCKDMCVWSTGCAICLHWIDPAEITTSIVGNKHAFAPKTCKDDFAPEIRASIQQQLQTIIEDRQRSIENLYGTWCALPENMAESFRVRYKMRMYHYTLYYYDRGGNLVRTVPPAGVQYVNSRADQPDHKYVTKYKYNSLKQMIWQSTPDGGVTNFYYNTKTQLRASQNAKQATSPERYSYSKYDALGRVIETGEIQTGSLPSNLDDIDYTSFPTSSHGTLKDVTLTYYSIVDAGATYLGDGITSQKYLQNRISYSISDVDGNTGTTGDLVKTVYSYDPHGNVRWLRQSVPGAAPKYLRYEYDLYSNNVVRLLYNERQEDQFIHRYEYDEDNRLKQVATSRDGYIWEVDGRYSYFDHGTLKRIVLGEDQVQGIDYTYTIQGWLKAMNHPSLSVNDDPGGDGRKGINQAVGKDAFGMILGYYQGDFNKSSSPFHSVSADKLWDVSRPHGGSLYNGNIASWETKIGSTAGGTQYAANRTGHLYRYDLLNRIKTAQFRYESSGWQTPAGDAYTTSYAYDPNGNIKRHIRYAHTGQMDDLTYEYDGAGGSNPTNRLEYVDDNPALTGNYTEDIDDQSAGNYDYDEIGNLTSDASENLTIEWTAAGKERRVIHTSGKVIEFLYDVAGNRVRKEVTGSAAPDENATTYYILAPDGRQLSMYRWSGVSTDSLEVEYSIYGSDRLGQRQEKFNANDRNVLTTTIAIREDIHSGGLRYTRRIGRQVYELKDHLDNVRVVVGDIKEPQGAGIYAADIKSYTNYDAFGMQQPGRYWSSDDYRYGFNGKEKDNEVKEPGSSYDFGARIYDSRIGRWMSTDPSERKLPMISPYVAFNDNPIIVIDPDGKEGIVLSSQPGTEHKIRTHFLVNGLDRAKKAQGKMKKGEKVTWIIFNEGGKAGYSDADLKTYSDRARKVGINVIVTNNTDEISNYINSKDVNNDDVTSARTKDKITQYYYVGHSNQYQLVGYGGSNAKSDVSDYEADAFAPTCNVNLVGGCNTAVSDLFTDSIVEDFQEILPKTATIRGTTKQVNYGSAAVDSEQDLIKNNKGPNDTPATIVTVQGTKK